MADNRLNKTGLRYLLSKMSTFFAKQVDLTALDTKVDEIIAEGGEPNVIEKVKVNGTEQTITNKKVNLAVPSIEATSSAHMTLTPPNGADALQIIRTQDSTNGNTIAFTGGDGFDEVVPTVEKMESYVQAEGGKIDKIKVNGTEQTITNKEVDLAVAELSIMTNPAGATGTEYTARIKQDSDTVSFNYMKEDGGNAPDYLNANIGNDSFMLATTIYSDNNAGKIDKIKVNGTEQTITNKEVDLTVPTKLSDLTNDGDGTTGSTFPTTEEMNTAIAQQIGKVYEPKGSVTFVNLPAPSASELGNVYNVTDAFTTTADFKEGAGLSVPAGSNVGIINDGTDENPVYKYDLFSGIVDLSDYWNTTNLTALTTAEIDEVWDSVFNPTP